MVLIALLVVVFAQVGGPSVVLQPAPSNPTVNVTIPQPDPQVVLESQRQAAPVIMGGGFEALDQDAEHRVVGFLNVGGNFSAIRRGIILQPRVIELNQGAQRLILATLALAIAALALWGLIGHFFGSDGQEAFEAIGHVPLWTLLALSSLAWYALLLTLFERIVGVLSSTSVSTLGAPFHAGFCPEIGPCQSVLTVSSLGLFGLLLAFLYVLAVLFFAFQMWINTAFLALAGAVAPLFVFSKVTPWTAHWGDTWLRMVPGTLGDLVAMTVVLVLGGPTLEQLGAVEPFDQIALRLGLLLVLGMVRHLFGLNQHSAGGRMFSTFMLARALRAGRGASAGGGAAAAAAGGATAGTAAASAAAVTRAPRWATSGFGTGTFGSAGAATAKGAP